MSANNIRIFVLNVPEFASLVAAAQVNQACNVTQAPPGYTLIESSQPLEFSRKALGLKPAVWYGLFTGGFQGRIETFDRDLVRIVT